MADKNNDLFSDLELEGFDEKYLKRTKDAVKAEKAKKADERIREFDSRPRTLAWAKEALTFCDREEASGKDIADISDGMMEIPRIRKEAQDILKAEERRIQEEESDRKNQARIRRAKETDDRIREFAARKKTVEWAEEAFDFCRREEENGRDIADISVCLKDLPRIRAFASDVLKQHEQDALRDAEQAEADAKAKAFADRVKETDERIREFAARKKTVEWANEAFDFCDREEKFGKDIAAYSSQLRDLPRIRELARDILNEEKERLAKAAADKAAADKAAADKAAADALAAADAKKRKIAELDALIAELHDSPKSRFWCEEVKNTDKQIAEQPREIKIKLKNLLVLDEMVQEVADVEAGAELGEKVIALARAKKKDEAWAKSVLSLEDEVADADERYFKEGATYQKCVQDAKNLNKAALNASRRPTVEKYEEFLSELEYDSNFYFGGQLSSVSKAEEAAKQYKSLHKGLSSLGFKLDEYITDFSARWKAAGNRAEQLKSDIQKKKRADEQAAAEAAAKAQAEKEKAAAAAAAKAAAEKAAEQKRAAKAAAAERSKAAAKVLFSILGCLVVVLGFVAAVIFLPAYRHWIIGVAVFILYTLFWTILYGKTDCAYGWWYFALSVAMIIASIPLACIPVTRPYGLCFSAAVFLSGLILCIEIKVKGNPLRESAGRWGGSRATDDGTNFHLSLYMSFIALMMLSVAIGVFFDPVAMAIVVGAICGVAFIAMGVSIATEFGDSWFDDENGVAMLVFDLIAALAALVFAWLSYEFSIIAMGLAAGLLVQGIICWIYRQDCVWEAASGFFAGLAVAIWSVLWFFFGFPTADATFKIEDGVLISYGGSEEVVVIPEEVTEIGDKAFAYNGPRKNMKTLVLHNGVQIIGSEAFKNCDALTTIEWGTGLKEIEGSAFYDCDGLTEVIIPEGVTSMGSCTFENSSKIKNVVLPDSLTEVPYSAFYGCDSLKTVYIGSGVTFMDSFAFTTQGEITFTYNGTEEAWKAIEKKNDGGWWTPWCDPEDIKEIIFAPKTN